MKKQKNIQTINERMQRMALMIEATTSKIIKKELKKLKNDIIKEMLRG